MSGTVVHDDDVLQVGLLANSGDLFVLLAGGNEDDARLGILQHEQALLAGLRGVDRDVDDPQQQAGEIGDRPLRAVLAEYDDAVALLDSPGLQLARGGVDPAAQLGGGDRLPMIVHARQASRDRLLRSISVKKTSLRVRGSYMPHVRSLRIPFRKISTTTSATFDS